MEAALNYLIPNSALPNFLRTRPSFRNWCPACATEDFVDVDETPMERLARRKQDRLRRRKVALESGSKTKKATRKGRPVLRVRHRTRARCPHPLGCCYPLCPRPDDHLVRACPELHAYCPDCGCRGHSPPRCGSRADLRELYDLWRDEGVFSTRARADSQLPRACWDFCPPYDRESCYWRTGLRYGCWVPQIPGLELEAVDDFDEEEGRRRDKVIFSIRWG